VVTVLRECADELAVTIPGFDGDVSVDDRVSECMTDIARTYEEGLAHLEFLARLWAEPVPTVPPLPVMTPVVDEPAEPVVAAAPLLADEPAMLPMAAATDVRAPVSADAPTAVELPVVVPAEPVLDEVPDEIAAEIPAEIPAEADDEADEADDAHVLLFAEAATAEIPVQAAA
jgi:hypothetical protein